MAKKKVETEEKEVKKAPKKTASKKEERVQVRNWSLPFAGRGETINVTPAEAKKWLASGQVKECK